jgi:hypothetical protein
MHINKVIILVVTILYVVINWLTFHDINEPHPVKDWLILTVTILTFIYFIRSFTKKTT